MDDYSEATIECTRCGTAVHPEMNSCPECGLNFYQPEHDAWQERWTGESSEDVTVGGISIAGVILGIVTAGSVMFAIQLFNGWVFSVDDLGWRLLTVVSGAVAGFVGGFLAGWLSEKHHLTVALIVGVLLIGLTIVFEAYWRDLSGKALINMRVVLTWGVILVSAFAGGIVTRNQALRVDHLFAANEEDLYHELMVRIGYDRALAERLIEYERQKLPDAIRPVLIRRAIYRWERDNQL